MNKKRINFLCLLFFTYTVNVVGQNNEADIKKAPKLLDLQELLRRVTNQPIHEAQAIVPPKLGRSKEEIKLMQLKKQGYAYLEADQYTKAIAVFNEVLAGKPRDKSARFGLATTYVKAKKIKPAIDMLNVLLKEFPNDYSIKNNLSWLYATTDELKFRNGKKAITLAQQALLVAPGDYHVWNTLSQAYYVSGEYKKGLRAAKEALYWAKKANVSTYKLKPYTEQVEKCQKAALALSILE